MNSITTVSQVCAEEFAKLDHEVVCRGIVSVLIGVDDR